MNREQAAATLRVLAAQWPKLLEGDPDVVKTNLELWYRNAFRYTPADDAQELVDRLVRTMTYAPRPADWYRVEGELKAERRRGKRHTPINRSDLPELEAGPEPDLSEVDRHVSIAKLRESIKAIGAAKDAKYGRFGS
jgi:hypothetical protein